MGRKTPPKIILKNMSKILFLADSPTVNTGFAHIGRNIARELLKNGHEIMYVGINEEGKWHESREWENLKITRAYQARDVLGRDVTLDLLNKEKYDYLFIIHDIFTLTYPALQGYSFLDLFLRLKQLKNLKTKLVFYAPVDFEFYGSQEYLESLKILNAIDVLIPYTHFAKEQLGNIGVNTVEPIYHGLYEAEWKPVSRQQKRVWRQNLVGDDRYKTTTIITVNGRNQWRKDFPVAIDAFAQYRKHNPNSFLYLNTSAMDIGGDLRMYTTIHGLKENVDFKFREAGERYGDPLQQIITMYQGSDMILNTARGEGFGLCYLEAQWLGVPVLAGDVSVESELLPQEYLVKPQDKSYVPSGQDASCMPRYTIDPEEMSKAIITYFDRPEEERKRIQQERQVWARELTMEKIGEEFNKYFK